MDPPEVDSSAGPPDSDWLFSPPRKTKPPAVSNSSWARTPIDAFVLSKLEAKGLSPAAPADRIALIRPVCFDLTGLPPSPEEVSAFLNNAEPGAYGLLLERVLVSPAYGER